MILANDSMVGPFISLRPLLEQLEKHARRRLGPDGLGAVRHSPAVVLPRFLRRRPRRPAAPALLGGHPGRAGEAARSSFGTRSASAGCCATRATSKRRRSRTSTSSGGLRTRSSWDGSVSSSGAFPFLKREILRDPEVAPAGEPAPAVVKRFLGVEVGDWVDDDARAQHDVAACDDSSDGRPAIRRDCASAHPLARLASRPSAVRVPPVDGWPADFDAWVDAGHRSAARRLPGRLEEP